MKTDWRRRAREAALQILYQAEIAGSDVGVASRTFFDEQWAGPAAAPDNVRAFATELAIETVRQQAIIDPLIAATAARWRPERMPVVDHLILKMGICELLRTGGAPPAVVINEALELARTFSTEESVKFVNGMLDAVRKKIEAEGGPGFRPAVS